MPLQADQTHFCLGILGKFAFQLLVVVLSYAESDVDARTVLHLNRVAIVRAILVYVLVDWRRAGPCPRLHLTDSTLGKLV